MNPNKKYQVVNTVDTACRIAEMNLHFLSKKSDLKAVVENTMLHGHKYKPLLEQTEEELIETAEKLNLLAHLIQGEYIIEIMECQNESVESNAPET